MANSHHTGLEGGDSEPGFRVHEGGSWREEAPKPPRRVRHRLATAQAADTEIPGERMVALARAVVRRAERHPFAAMAIALGVGVVLGGGLSTRLGRLALVAAGRFAARELLKSTA